MEVSMSVKCSSNSISRGDKVQQIAPVGLVNLVGAVFVVDVVQGTFLELSKEPNGPSLTDLHGQTRHYPLQRFRKITWET